MLSMLVLQPAMASASLLHGAAVQLRTPRARMGLPPVDPMQLDVVNNEEEVATVVCNRLEAAATATIAERGHFALAIPGGSVMKMLAKTSPSWAAQCTLVSTQELQPCCSLHMPPLSD